MKTPDTINGKTPEEIKKNAETCLNHPPHAVCNVCRLFDECGGIAEHIIKQVYDLVLYYESRLAQTESKLAMAQAERDATNKDRIDLMTRLAQAERERDAMMADMKEVGCGLCKHAPSSNDIYIRNECLDCVRKCNFEWRGVQENAKEET